MISGAAGAENTHLDRTSGVGHPVTVRQALTDRLQDRVGVALAVVQEASPQTLQRFQRSRRPALGLFLPVRRVHQSQRGDPGLQIDLSAHLVNPVHLCRFTGV